MNKMLATQLTLLTFLFVISVNAYSQACPGSPGCLDPTFGVGGSVSTVISSGNNSRAQAVAVQPWDGMIVVAAVGSNPSPATDSYVLRYDANGVLDPTFGIGGITNTSFTAEADSEGAGQVAIQSDGKIIVVSNPPMTVGSTVHGFGVARLNSDGTFDTSFGTGGKLLFNFTNNVSAYPSGVAIQPDGYIVIAGISAFDFAFARVTPWGTLDPGFNGSGKVTVKTSTSADAGQATAGAKAVVIQPLDGKIVATGWRPPDKKTGRDVAVVRLNVNGTLDSTFGSGGKVFTDFSKLNDEAMGIAIDSANKIVVVGRTARGPNITDYRFGLARYLPNGQLDTTFGSGGKVVAGLTGYYNQLRSVSIQANGQIVTSGLVYQTSGNNLWALARFQNDGIGDTTYGTSMNGIVVTDFPGVSESCSVSALQPDGKLIGAGYGNNMANILLARYLP